MADLSPRFRFRIVGLPYHDAPDVHAAVSNDTIDILVPGLVGAKQWIPLELQPDTLNTSDPNAVKVVIPGRCTHEGQDLILGYIPKDECVAMSFLIGACESRGRKLGCGLRMEGLRPAIKEAVWSGEMETTGAADFLKPSRRGEPDFEDIFPDQFGKYTGETPVSGTQRTRRRKVQHMWI